MKNKEKQTVVAFPNTTSALAMEAACREYNIPGNIIPVPNQITSACGFAWRAPAKERERIQRFLAEKGLTFDRVYTLDL